MHDMLRPVEAEIISVRDEATGLKTFVLKPAEPMHWKPGQFVLVSRMGWGESTFAISSDPARSDTVAVSVQAVGKNTRALHELDPGDRVGIRGPYGNSFPMEQWKGRNVLLAGGGIGLAPLRPVILSLLAHRQDYGTVRVVAGAREPELMPFKKDLESWKDGLSVVQTVDSSAPGWRAEVGVVPVVMEKAGFQPENSVAVICGPPIMIHYGVESLLRMGFTDASIYTTLEMKMKCGVGVCGRCNIDHRYICKDGPVFSLDQLEGTGAV